jgi:hypothetical protein
MSAADAKRKAPKKYKYLKEKCITTKTTIKKLGRTAPAQKKLHF